MAEHELGSGLEVPGIEGKLEYGDASTVRGDRIPGAYMINDHSAPDRTRLTQLSGLHDDPDGRDASSPLGDAHGERAGKMFYSGRTIGLTGRTETLQPRRMRDEWRKLKSQFGSSERDLVIHPPLEIRSYTNELSNPSWAFDDADWEMDITGAHSFESSEGGYESGPETVGRYRVTTTETGLVLSVRQRVTKPWNGGPLFASCRVKVATADGVVPSARLMIRGMFGVDWQVASEGAPVVGEWHELSGLPPIPLVGFERHIDFSIEFQTSSTGYYEFLVDRATLVPLGEDQDPPPGYFDGDFPGFEWSGEHYRSTSSGPFYSVNLVDDPIASDVDEDDGYALRSWRVRPGDGVEVEHEPSRMSNWAGAHTGGAFTTITKDLGPIPRNFIVESARSVTPASAGRTYRWSGRVNVISYPGTGSVVGRLVFYDADGDEVVESSALLATAGESDFSVLAVAPVGTVAIAYQIALIGTATSKGILRIAWADCCLSDISDYDAGPFFGYDSPYESPAVGGALARRAIPRPFLVRRVRKVPGDIRAPEQQASKRASRDFSMALRARDPRIYILDPRSAAARTDDSPHFVSDRATDIFVADGSISTPPSGFTYDGHYITHPGSGSPYLWSTVIGVDLPSPGSNHHPRGGFGIKTWTGTGTGANEPAQSLNARMYRGADTYTEPRVVLGGAPNGFGHLNTYPPNDMKFAQWYPGGFAGPLVLTNRLTLILKRTGSAWLELRWSGAGKRDVQPTHPIYVASAPYALELWSSHGESGAAGATRLAGADLTSSPARYVPLPMLTTPYHLVAWLIDDVVRWELWGDYPNAFDTTNRLEMGSYQLPPGLAAVIGSAVSGHCGLGMRIPVGEGADAGDNSWYSGWPKNTMNSPWVHYFETSKADVPPVSIPCPVIGDFDDTPQRIVLGGDMLDPVITISVPDYAGEPAATSTAFLQGTTSASNPIVIDLDDLAIPVRDSIGNNRMNMRMPGSSFIRFRPGVNLVSVQAKNYSETVSVHFSASWRDAYR